jgi:hypothetical protein
MAEAPCPDVEATRPVPNPMNATSERKFAASVESDEKCQNSDDEIIRPSSKTPRGTNDFSKKTTMELSDYFVGPRDINRHSKIPIPLRFCK